MEIKKPIRLLCQDEEGNPAWMTLADLAGLLGAVNTPEPKPEPPKPGPDHATFALTGIKTLSWVKVSPTEALITIQPEYKNDSGKEVSFWIHGLTTPSWNRDPRTIRVYTDNPVLSARAKVLNSVEEIKLLFNWVEAVQAIASTLPPSIPKPETPKPGPAPIELPKVDSKLPPAPVEINNSDDVSGETDVTIHENLTQ